MTIYRITNNADKNISFEKKYTNEIDHKYFEAIESGNIEEVKKMVEEAARRNGYTIKASHTTKKKFNAFSLEKSKDLTGRTLLYGLGGNKIYFSKGHNNYPTKDRTINVFLKIENPFPEEDYERMMGEYAGLKGYRDFWDIKNPHEAKIIRDKAIVKLDKLMKNEGYDAIVGNSQIAIYNPNQIKSADPITYADNGEIISLLQRFNSSLPDIRSSNHSPTFSQAIKKNINSIETISKMVRSWAGDDIKANCLSIAKKLQEELKKNGYNAVLVMGTYSIDNPDFEAYSDWDVNDFNNQEEMDEAMLHPLHYWVEANGIIIDITADQFNDELDGEEMPEIIIGPYSDWPRYTPQNKRR